MILRLVFLVFLISTTTSCASIDREYGQSANIEVTTLETLPRPAGAYVYRIGPQEVLQIEVVGSQLLSGKFQTDERGDLNFPLAGEVAVGGKTLQVAADMIAAGLSGKFVKNPQVRILPNETVVPSVSIGGQVGAPGNYPVLGRHSLLRMVNAAGGLSKYAKTDDILVFREVDGQRYIGLYNINTIQRGNSEDPELYPNDVVMVGDSPARRRLENILQLVPIVTAASIVIDRTTR